MTSYKHYIGIDIAKETFVVCRFGEDNVMQYDNNKEGFAKFVKDYAPQGSLVVMEYTGGYEQALSVLLAGKGIATYRVDPKKAHYFHKSLRLKGKTDKIDAQGLARYAFERCGEIRPDLVYTTAQLRLRELQARREDLTQMCVQEKNRIKSPARARVRESCLRMIEALKEEIETIEKEIRDVIAKDPDLKAGQEVLMTIPGIGEVTATTLLATLPELGKTGNKQIASLAGLAPHPKDSGDYRGRRQTCGSGRRVKAAIFLAAMAARRCLKGVFRDFYERLIKAGKVKKVALVALARKIVVTANARMKEYYAHHNLS